MAVGFGLTGCILIRPLLLNDENKIYHIISFSHSNINVTFLPFIRDNRQAC